MKCKLIFLAVILFATVIGAQTVSLDGVRDPYLRGVKPIMENGVVNGYTLFTFLDKSDRKNSNYEIRIYDANLREKYKLDLTKSNDYRLLESSYNNSHLSFIFIDLKKDILEQILVDEEGKIAGTYRSPELTRTEKYLIMQTQGEESNPYSFNLIGVPEQGFIMFNSDTDHGWNSKITMVNNEGIKKWQIIANETKEKDYAFAFPLTASPDRLVTTVNIKGTMLSQKFKESYLLFHNIANGKKVAKILTHFNKHEHSPAGANYEPLTEEFLIYGEYFDPEKNIIKDKSKGLFISRYTKDGKFIGESLNSWDKELKNALGLNDKGKMDDNMTLAVLELTRMNDGKIFAICEQFKKTADAGGIALNVIATGLGGSGNMAMAKAVKGDLVILEFDSTFKLIKNHKFEKKKSDVTLMSGSEYMSTGFIGSYLKHTGSFDYISLTKSPDNNNFNVLYINWDKEKGQKNNYVIGNVSYNNKMLVQDKLRLTTEPYKYTALPGKPGFTLIYEYFKKEKRVTLRMEKIKT